MSTTVKLSKLSAPIFSRIFNRTRLFDLLDQGLTGPALWIGAPAGSGKTALVSSYLAERGLSALWYRMDEGDSDTGAFFYHLSLLADDLSTEGTPALPCFSNEYMGGLVTFARNFFHALFARMASPSVLVLDNCQAQANASPLHELLAQLIAEVPEPISIVMISRESAPICYARLQLDDQLLVLGWEVLRLDRQEADGVAQQWAESLPNLIEGQVEAAYQHSQGWLAGFILMLRAPDSVVLNNVEEMDNQQVIFDYFCHEVFATLETALQQFLLKTALLPEVTTVLAQQVTGLAEAERMLELLAREQFFVVRHGTTAFSFEYHPLFKTLLQRIGAQQLPILVRQQIQREAAKLLIENGVYDMAAQLLEEAVAYDELSVLILKYAPILMEQNRVQRLQYWLDRLPVGKPPNPWLLYWRASAELAQKPMQARVLFEQALPLFEALQQREGVLLCWAGVVESFIFAWDDFQPLDQWIAWMDRQLQCEPSFPSPQIEARIVFAMFVSLMYRQPQHVDMALWAKRVERLLDQLPDDNLRVAMAAFYLHYLATIGELSHANLILDRIKPCATLAKVKPVNLIAWQQSEAMYYWLMTDFKASQKALDTGLALAQSSGVHLWDFVLLVQAAYTGFESANKQQRQQQLQCVVALMDQYGRLHRSHYYYLASLEALLSRDPIRAREHICQSLNASIELGAPFPISLARIAMARVLIELGELVQAEEQLALAAISQINSDFLRFNIALTQAELAIKGNQPERIRRALEEGMGLARCRGFFHTDYWRPYAMTALAIEALKLGIELDYVSELIQRRHLQPDTPPLDVPHWPWQVRIFTLGRFGVMIDNQALTLDDRVTSKPLLLLKALIALGGRDVSVDSICAVLWPDAEGDVARSAFATNLSRLRKMLFREALILKNNCLSLNDRYCWLDSWALERQFTLLDQTLSQAVPTVESVQRQAAELFNVYKGGLFAQQNQMDWMLAPRERLHLKLLRTIKRLIAYYEQHEQPEEMIFLYEKALALDEVAEEHYRGLMCCYAAQGKPAEALSVYQQCCAVFQGHFDMAPSAEITQLYQQIKAAWLG